MGDSEKLTVGLRVNPKRKDSGKQPTLFFWMWRLDKDEQGNNVFVDTNPGAIWIRTTDELKEAHKASAYDVINRFLTLIDKKLISVKGSLDVQAIYEALELHWPPEDFPCPHCGKLIKAGSFVSGGPGEAEEPEHKDWLEEYETDTPPIESYESDEPTDEDPPF